MFGYCLRIAGVLTLSTAFACGSGDLKVYNSSTPDGGGETVVQPGEDAAEPAPDMGTPDPNDVGSEPDLVVVDPPDMAELPPDMPPDDAPTTNVPQQGPNVGSQVTGSCSTISVKGMSLQLIDQMNCLDPGVMKSFDGAPGLSYGASVFPFQQGPATDVLTAVAANNAGTMPVTSALRTLPQQFLLYEWYNRSLCNANLAASPGRSNHNGGLAIDIGDSGVWRTPMRNQSYVDNVSGEPWHFYFSGAGGKDVRNLSVLAFQQLYNYNFPENRIAEDGAYGPMTEAALKESPANGFAEQPSCGATTMMLAYPHRAPLDLQWERLGDGLLGVQTLAPKGVHLVEYYIDDVLAGYAGPDAYHYETVLRVPRTVSVRAGEVYAVEAVAYDYRGEERGRVRGIIETRDDAPVFIRPVGGDNYEIGLDDPPDSVRSVDFFVDGIPVDQEAWLAISQDKRRLSTQLRGEHEITVVLLDRKDRVIDMRVLDASLADSSR